MSTYPTPEPISVDVELGMGSVEINASDRADTIVEVTPGNPARSGDVSLAGEATVRFADGRLTISVPKRLNLIGPGDTVDVRVDLPTGSQVAIANAYGNIRARGQLGATRVTAAYGDIVLEHAGDLKLKSPHGGVEVDVVAGDLDLTAGHGHLRIGRVDGRAEVRGSHGYIELGVVDGEIDARTSGVITVGRAGTNTAIRTAYGALRVREVGGGTVRLENGYGTVEVGVPNGTAAWVDAASQHGRVRNELESGPAPDATGRTVELRLRSNYGDIFLHRAPAT
ncbi:MAG: hypothetical protein JWP66_1341 [Naasia sp.]|jgi:DUF4097 and DUF4098 domain-containing protein YvlB|nr:hypothetical protein [Naasia sp.]